MRKFNLILTVLLTVLISCNQGNIQRKYSYTKWKVDTKGNKISKSEFKSFDDKNNLTKWIQYLDNGKTDIDSFSYEFEGKLKVKEFRYTNGKLWTKTIFIYGKDNKLKETKCFDRDEKLESETKHTLTDNSEVVENYSDGELYSIDSLRYNHENKIISEIQYMTDGTWFQKHKYEYDSNGNLLLEQAEANSEFDGIGLVEFRYVIDKNNRTTKETVLYPDKSKEYYIYEYDNDKK